MSKPELCQGQVLCVLLRLKDDGLSVKKTQAWRVSFQDATDNQLNFHEFTFTEKAKVEELGACTATRMLLDDWHSFEDGLHSPHDGPT